MHSYHHQGVDRLGDGLVVTARTDDGLVAGVRVHGRRLRASACSGIPSRTLEDRRLFAGLVAAGIRATPSRAHELGSDVVSGDTSRVINPADRARRSARCRAPRVGEVDAAIARAVAAQRAGPALAPVARADALRCLRARRRGARRGARAARGAQLRAPDRLGAVGGGARRAGAELLRRARPSG